MRQADARAGALAALLACLLAPAGNADAQSLTGTALPDALDLYEQRGLRLFYSSDLVRHSMQVTADPDSAEPLDAVMQILAPHGLRLRRGLGDSWLVVRADKPTQQTEVPPTRSTVAVSSTSLQQAPPIEELIVAASRYEIAHATGASEQLIATHDLQRLPDLGEDAVRAVARLPGVASNGFSAMTHIRGGEPGETLVRFDGMRLYDPFHLRDFQSVFSAIDPRIVDSMNVYTGGFPADYGDRLSGVIDFRSSQPTEALHHEIGASFFNTSLLSTGRFADDDASWLVSLRRSNLSKLYQAFSDLPDRPSYFDVFAKLEYELSDSLSLTASVIAANDDIEIADDEDREEFAYADQDDRYAWLRIDFRPRGTVHGSAHLARTTLSSHRNGSTEKSGISTGTLTDERSFTLTSLKSDWTSVIGSRLLLDFGAEILRMDGRYDYSDNAQFEVLFDTPGAQDSLTRTTNVLLQPDGRQTSVYSKLRVDWSENLASEFGLRLSSQSIDGISHSTASPRIGVSYQLSDRSGLRASWGVMHQAQLISELAVSDGEMRFSAPQRARQLVVGYDRRLRGDVRLRVEAYRKDMNRLRARYENLLNQRVVLPELKPDRIRIDADSGQARGLEIAVEGSVGIYDWWSNLTWSRVTDNFAGREVLRSWDQTRSVSAGFSAETGKWTVSTALSYRTGWPTTTVIGPTDFAAPVVGVPARNDRRLSAFASLDVRANRRFQFGRSELNAFIEITNVSDRRNTCCLEYEIGEEDEAGQFILDERSFMGAVPSIGFNWQF